MVGQPPMQYLGALADAARVASADGRRPLAAVATAIGYESEAAFSRAFKKLVGQSPGRGAGHSIPME